jgi:hypothetical protein
LDYLDSVSDKRKEQQENKKEEFLHKQSIAQSKQNTKQIVDAIETDSKKTKNVKIVNDMASKDDIQEVIDQLKEVQLAQLLGNQKAQGKPAVVLANGTDVEDIMAPLAAKIDEALRVLANNNKDEKVAKQLDRSFSDFAESLAAFMVQNQEAMAENAEAIERSISVIDVKPVVNVPAPKVNVQSNPEVDLSPLEDKLDALRSAIQAIPAPEFDTTEMTSAVAAVQNSIENLRFPVPNYVLPFRDIEGAATQVQLDAEGNLPITVEATETTDMFGQVVTATRYNQVEIDFAGNDPDSITELTVTKSNGGDAATANGQAVFTTSVATNGGIKAVSNTTIDYRPHAESYAAFTAIFTAGVANSYQRIGIYDTNNGFFIGYEGTSFGVTKRTATVDTTTAQASFNIDTLSGAAGSKFTRGGTPEALDPTKDNLYRIRFGWLGAAPILFEVFSPDGEWVPFHIIRIPNGQVVPSVANPNLPITLDAQKTAGATNITMSTACWAAGTTSNFSKISSTLTSNTLASLTRSVITGETTAGGGGFVNVKVNPSGALTVEATSATPDTGTVSTASVTNSNTTVLAANNQRLGATIYNEGTVNALIKLGSTASATSYTVRLIPDAYYEVPFGYTGIITGITASGTATCRVTELT